ncbi:MAG: biopolymer transporter ExbD, partial [Proteobacteria bacterium]|nr:biopolymer transporter ExbD [Pseudomonadota bacterium]
PPDIDSPEPIVITVDAKGHMYLNIASQPESSIGSAVLVEQVAAALRKQPRRPVMVRGDANGPYQNVIKILVLLQQANVESVGLVTEPPELN